MNPVKLIISINELTMQLKTNPDKQLEMKRNRLKQILKQHAENGNPLAQQFFQEEKEKEK